MFIDWQKINSISKNNILEQCSYLILSLLSTFLVTTADRPAFPPMRQRLVGCGCVSIFSNAVLSSELSDVVA